MLRPRLARPDRVLRLLDVAPMQPGPGEEVVQASIADAAALADACRSVDAVVHLAGIATEAAWDDILATNIDGTYRVLDAARRAGVGRFVFASSNHAVGYYPRDRAPAADDALPAPDTYYGVSKVLGEALGSLYHSRHGMDVVCLRILSCTERPTDLRMLSTWLSPDDAGRLFDAALTTPAPGFRVVWGVSRNTRSWFTTAGGEAIGYEPVDDAERFAPELIARFGEPDPDDPLLRAVGGAWAP
jgi:nucleoside-diphosphate-sugar epimerase